MNTRVTTLAAALAISTLTLAAIPAMAQEKIWKKPSASKSCSFTYGGGTYNFGPDGKGTWTEDSGLRRTTTAEYKNGTVTYQRFSGNMDSVTVGNVCK